MTELLPFFWHLLAMAVLIGCSGFFSCSEAALFYLGREDRKRMISGGLGDQAAVRLLDDPDRLLTAILFWNLVINLLYFALASAVSLGLHRAGASTQAGVVTVGALVTIIVISEMLPKNVGVIWPRRLAGLLGLPLAAATRVLDPIAPALKAASDFSSRLIAPRFKPEPVLELTDLERAITLGGNDPQLAAQERNVLSRVVAMSEVTAEEIMRPRRRYVAFSPPVMAADLDGQATPSGYLLVTEPDSDEIAAALDIRRAAVLPDERLDLYAEPVAFVPWSLSAAGVLTALQKKSLHVVAVLNEFGETIGIVTRDDLVANVLQHEQAARHPRDLNAKITTVGPDRLQVTGRTTLRRLGKQLGRVLPASKNITVGGLAQEQLQRIPQAGDTFAWGGLRWRAVQADGRGGVTVEIEPEPEHAADANGEPT
ncbi:MAG: CNNM domain-containing protein [Planctomycetota bacterium]